MVLDKTECSRLLYEASINDTSKFCAVLLEKPKTRGRPPKYYHPLLQKEKTLDSIVRRILPKTIADSVSPTGSRLAHLYGLPKTHNYQRPTRTIILLQNGSTRNWSPCRLISIQLMILLISQMRYTSWRSTMGKSWFRMMSPRYSQTFGRNNRAFTNNWFNTTHNLDLTKTDLVDLLSVATKGQLFQFAGALYEQTDGVAMGPLLGPY